jgi:hypothetical protein
VVAVPVMAMMMLITANKKIIREFTVRGSRLIIGWFATVVMAAAAVGMVITGML